MAIHRYIHSELTLQVWCINQSYQIYSVPGLHSKKHGSIKSEWFDELKQMYVVFSRTKLMKPYPISFKTFSVMVLYLLVVRHCTQLYTLVSAETNYQVMRKPDFCMCENKNGHREADQRLSFRYIDSTISLRSKSEILSFKPSSVAVQPGLCRIRSETPKTGFTTRLKSLIRPKMSRLMRMRQLVFGLSDQVRHKLGYAATEGG